MEIQSGSRVGVDVGLSPPETRVVETHKADIHEADAMPGRAVVCRALAARGSALGALWSVSLLPGSTVLEEDPQDGLRYFPEKLAGPRHFYEAHQLPQLS